MSLIDRWFGKVVKFFCLFLMTLLFVNVTYLSYTWVDYYYGFDLKCWYNDWDCKTIVYTSESSFDGIHKVNIGTTKCQIKEELPEMIGGFYAQGKSLGYEAEQTLTKLKNEGWVCS